MTPEKQIETAIVKDFEKHHCYIRKYQADQHTNKGVPDRLACYHGNFVGLEIKRLKGGKPTPVQIRNLVEIAYNGGISLITSNKHVYHDLNVMINQHQIPSTIMLTDDFELLKKACFDASAAHALWSGSKTACNSASRSVLITMTAARKILKDTSWDAIRQSVLPNRMKNAKMGK